MATTKLSDVCRVCAVSQDLIQVEILDSTEFKNHTGRQLTIGSYLKITDEDDHSVIALVQSYRIKDPSGVDSSAKPTEPSFILDAQPVGFLDADGHFRRGGQQIAIPPTQVSLATDTELSAIYACGADEELLLGTLAQSEAIEMPVYGDLFFSKHIAVVCST